MTGLLNDLMHDRADRLDAPSLDVTAITDAGERVVRRRWAGAGALGAAAAVAAVVLVPQAFDRSSDVAPEWSYATAFEAHEPSYAVGSTITIDGHSFDVGRTVKAMVQTTSGVVFADQDWSVWAADGEGTTRRIGTTGAEWGGLRADGSVAAWVATAGPTPEFAAFDQATGEVFSTPYEVRGGFSEYSPTVWAIDGYDVWFRDDRGVVRWNVRSGAMTELGPVIGVQVDDVRDGMVAYSVPGTSAGPRDYFFGPTLEAGTGSPLMTVTALSPDATLALGRTDQDLPGVADTGTGQVTTLELPEYDFFAGVNWLDNQAFVAIGVDEPFQSSSMDLLTCQLGNANGPRLTPSCEVSAAAIGTTADGVVIPGGRPSL